MQKEQEIMQQQLESMAVEIRHRLQEEASKVDNNIMTKKELIDIINEEISDAKHGVTHFLVTEEFNESDRDEIRKIIRQEVSAIFFDLFKKRKSWGA